MGRIIAQLLACTIVLAALGVPQGATAAEVLLPPVSGRALTEFGARYETAAGTVTHRGLDLAAEAGAHVLAAADGVVTFAGLVPADGGGRTTAVTITTPGGMLVTVSPLEAATIGKGANVVAGDELGVLSASGDGSSAQTHVHLSARVAGTYVDPRPMLVIGAPEPKPAPEPQPAAGPRPQPAPAAEPAAAAASAVGEATMLSVPAPQASASAIPAAFGGTSVAAAAAATQAQPLGIGLRALEQAQAGLRAGARIGAAAGGAARAAHIAPEMLRNQSQQPAPHFSAARTAGAGVLLALATGLALWIGFDRRAPVGVRATR